jgi:hypothetical protein
MNRVLVGLLQFGPPIYHAEYHTVVTYDNLIAQGAQKKPATCADAQSGRSVLRYQSRGVRVLMPR